MRLTERLNAIRDTLAAPELEVSKRQRAGIFLVRLSIRIIKQWIRDKPMQQAAALTFQTALSLVPLLAIAFTLLRATADQAVENDLMAFVSTRILPDMPEISNYLQTFSRNISTGALGAAGLLFTFFTSWYLYNSVERVFNDIWRTARRRALLHRLLTFYALVTLLPVLAGASLYSSGRLVGTGGGAKFLVPLLLQVGALFLTNKLLPNTLVRWRFALAGTVVTALALEGLKLGFVTFAKRVMLDNYQGVYGNIGLIPLLLVWMNISWLFVLLGAEVANALQNLKILEAEDRRRTGDEPINGVSAAQVLAMVAADHRRGGGGVPREQLSEKFGLTVQAVAEICRRLSARGLIAEVHGDKEGFIPGRLPSSIKLEEVLSVFRATDFEAAGGVTSPALLKVISDLEQARRQRVAGVTIADLEPDLEPRNRLGVRPGELLPNPGAAPADPDDASGDFEG